MYAKSTKGKDSTVPSDDQAKEKLALYVYEYLIHVGAFKAAQTFLAEIRWEKNITLGESPGFLCSWWSVFWELYCAAPERRENFEHSIEAEAFHHYNASAPSPLSQMPPHNGMPGGMPPRFSPHLEDAISEVQNLLPNQNLVVMNAMTGALDQDRINYEIIKQENGGGSKRSKKSVPGLSGVSPMQGMMPGMQPMPGFGYGPTMPGTSMGHNGNSPLGMSSNYTSYTHSMYPNDKIKSTRKKPCGSMMFPCTNVNAISAPFKPSFPDAVSQVSSSHWPPVSTDFKPLVTAPEPTFPTYSGNSVPIKTEASSSPHISDCKASANIACFNESCKLMHPNEDLSLQEKMREVKENLFETFGEDLICIICSELFIKPSVLDCSHTFCEYCIKAWKKTKNNCPMCRKRIKTVTRVLTLDSFIEKTVEKLKPEERYGRAKLIKERQEAEEKSFPFAYFLHR